MDEFEASWIRQAVFRVVALKIVVLTLAFDAGGLQAFDYPKALLSRATEWVLVGLILLALLRFGLGILPRTRLHLAVAAYVLAVVASAAAGENAYVSFFGEQDSYQGLTQVGDMVVLYLAVGVAYRRRADFQLIAFTMMAAAAIASMYAVVQSAGLDPLEWTRDPSIRPFGTFGNPIQLAHYLSVTAGLCLGLTLFEPSVRVRLTGAVATAAFVVVSGLTGARSGLVGLAAAVGAALIVVPRRRSESWTRRLPLALAAAVVSAVAVLSPTGQRLVEGPLADRIGLYEIAARAFMERPLLGYGPDQFSIAFTRHHSAGAPAALEYDERHVWAHNFILQALVTTGAVGGLALLTLIVLVTGSLWRSIRIEPRVAAPLLIASTAYWSEALLTVSSVSVDWFPWLVFGIASALAGRVPSEIRRRPLAPLARGAVIAAAFAAALTGFAALRANHDAGSARASLLVGQSQPAVAAAASAVALDRGRADYWNWLGIANEASGRWLEANAAYSEAVQRSSHVAIYWANLARARARLAMNVDSREAYSRALAIDPLNPVVRRSLADTAFILGDCDQALEEIVAAYEVSHADAKYATELERAASCAVDLTSGRRTLMRALELGETASLHASLARVLFRIGDVDAARASAQRALRLDAANATAREVLDLAGPGR
ncbi:MAG: O-antigen ligase family protein [Gaiellales bacterium]